MESEINYVECFTQVSVFQLDRCVMLTPFMCSCFTLCRIYAERNVIRSSLVAGVVYRFVGSGITNQTLSSLTTIDRTGNGAFY